MGRRLIILAALFIVSSCNMNCYKEKVIRKKTKKEIKQKPSKWDIFIQALIQVESEGKEDAVGTKNDVGILQITPIFVKDVNRILGEKRYTLSCRTDKRKSLEMFEILQNHYNPDKDIDKAIKLHNSKASQSYRTKIMKQMEIINASIYDNTPNRLV